MQQCEQCRKHLRVGDEVHVIDDMKFCSAECAIVHLADEIICSAKEAAKEAYNSNVTILTLRPTKDSANCATCKKDLAKCDTIFAAEGRLYCSRACGVRDYTLIVTCSFEQDDNTCGYADEIFDSVSEELSPKDIGLEVQDET